MNEARLAVAPPFKVVSGSGATLTLEDGSTLIDTLSSWWCKSFGHGNQRLRDCLKAQADDLDHVIFANCRHRTIDQLSDALQSLHHQSGARVFYTSEGSSAIEMAIKLCEQYALDKNPEDHASILCLSNGYHGETIGAMSVSDMDLYKRPFAQLCFKANVLTIPYHRAGNPLGAPAPDLGPLEKQLEKYKGARAIIIEPLVQGAAGMQMYHPAVLTAIDRFAKQHAIPLIADEIMTGMGRCGALCASSLAAIKPDIICLSKGLTGGWFPFSATIVAPYLYDHFRNHRYQDSFLHSHTYCGNPLGARLALEILAMLKEVDAHALGERLLTILGNAATRYSFLSKPRQLGAIAALEITRPPQQPDIFPAQVVALAARHGLLLRPIGTTVYLMPPLNSTEEELACLERGLMGCFGQIETLLGT